MDAVPKSVTGEGDSEVLPREGGRYGLSSQETGPKGSVSSLEHWGWGSEDCKVGPSVSGFSMSVCLVPGPGEKIKIECSVAIVFSPGQSRCVP